MIRIGHGYDVHAFGGDKPLILGGVRVEGHQGLLAHSDGDVLLHAVCDALLGAAGLGDIGKHFPDTDAQFANADSRKLLREVISMLHTRHWAPQNIDISVIAETPRMSSHIDEIRNNIALDAQLESSQVNVKATTTEKLGYIGRKEGVAVHAVTLIVPR